MPMTEFASTEGRTFKTIEAQEGKAAFITKLAAQLKDKPYRADAVRRAGLSKPEGGQRLPGIPATADRVVQTRH